MAPFSFENIRRSEERLPETEEALYEILVKENEKKAIDPEDFSDDDHYGAEVVKRDKEYVDRMEKTFEEKDGTENTKRFAELFEALVDYQIDNSDLMGAAANVIKPSRYDDVVNKIDSIVQFEQETGTSQLALAIDVTKNPAALSKKMKQIRDSIDSGELSKVKYFKTSTFRGELRGIPRVVVGADRNTVENISQALLRFIRMQKEVPKNRSTEKNSPVSEKMRNQIGEVRNELANHPLQRIVLIEIREQLSAFQNYAESKNKHEQAENYRKLLNVIDNIITEKDLGKKNDFIDDDVYNMIREKVRDFGKNAS